MQIKFFCTLFVFCVLNFFSLNSSAQVSEPFNQVIAESLSKFTINLTSILDRSIIRASSVQYLLLQMPNTLNSCSQQTQMISMTQQKDESSLVQSLTFTDCNNNRSVISIIQPLIDVKELTLKDWLNGNWKLSEMKAWRIHLSHRRLLIEKKDIIRDGKILAQVLIDYTNVPDSDIPTDTARLIFEEFKSESLLMRNYSIDVGKISPTIYLRFQNTLNSTANSKDIFSQSLYFDQSGEISPKSFASQYQSYLANIIFKSVHSALGTIPLVLPSL